MMSEAAPSVGIIFSAYSLPPELIARLRAVPIIVLLISVNKTGFYLSPSFDELSLFLSCSSVMRRDISIFSRILVGF